MPIEPRTLDAVFTQVGRCLEGHGLALETLDAYKADAASGLMTLPRLRGFLQGLWAAGALPFEDYCEVDAKLSPPDDEAGCYWHIGATRPCSKCSTGVVTMTVPNQLRICPACVEKN